VLQLRCLRSLYSSVGLQTSTRTSYAELLRFFEGSCDVEQGYPLSVQAGGIRQRPAREYHPSPELKHLLQLEMQVSHSVLDGCVRPRLIGAAPPWVMDTPRAWPNAPPFLSESTA
jgi:hypothetical protein